MSRYSHIIWDWNGTLIDDVWLGVEIINEMLIARGIPPITIERYRSVFGFPVRDYYREIGFLVDEEPEWEAIATEFIACYHRRMGEIRLFPDVKAVLTAFQEQGLVQVILSAMEQKTLTRHVAALGIAQYFSLIQGIDNHYANGKGHMAKSVGERLGTDPQNILFIGDTLHDIEVARSIGCECVLCSRGHQSKERLITAGVPVVDSFEELTRNLSRL